MRADGYFGAEFVLRMHGPLVFHEKRRAAVTFRGRAAAMLEQRLSDLIGFIYDAAIRPELWPEVLRQVTEVTPCTVATIYGHDLVNRASTVRYFYGISPEHLKDYIDRWSTANPIIDAMKLREPGDVSGLLPILDFEAFKKHPFYIEWGAPQRYCDSINVMLERTPTRLASVSLITTTDQGFADPAMIQRLRLLAPHFLRSIRIGRVLDRAVTDRETLVASLDAMAMAVLLFTPDGGLVHANQRASALIRDGLSIAKLRAGAKLSESAAGVGRRDGPDGGDDRAFVVEADGGARFVCHTLSIAFGPQPRSHRSRLVMLVIQSAEATDRAVGIASRLYGLTRRERDVLFGLVEVGGIGTVAATLGVSKTTVKSHVDALFRKTETRRQSELVKLIGDLQSPFREQGRAEG